MIAQKENSLILFSNAGGLVVDCYENDGLYISLVSAIDRYVWSNTIEYAQKAVLNGEYIFDFSMEIEEAEELLSFLKEAYPITSNELKTRHYSKISFYYQYGYVWGELLALDNVKPFDLTFLLDEMFTLEYNQDQLGALIENLEKAISLAKKEGRDWNG